MVGVAVTIEVENLTFLCCGLCSMGLESCVAYRLRLLTKHIAQRKKNPFIYIIFVFIIDAPKLKCGL